MSLIERVDAVAYDPCWAPHRGWHEDQLFTSAYLPALQQVRGECASLLEVLEYHLPQRANALQLGLGECDASHVAWKQVFSRVTSIDWRLCLESDAPSAGMDTHCPEARVLAHRDAPYDFLFIDAGHGYVDVASDYCDYAPFVRRGGIIAFHDAWKRFDYPEIEVWKFLAELQRVTYLGDVVGTAWTLR